MHPILLQLGPLPLHTYGFLIAMGFLLGLMVNKKLAIRSGLDPARIMDICFYSLVIGIVGARILFVITRWDYFMKNPLDIFKLWEGGLVFFGGLVGVLIFAIWFLRRFKLPYWKTADALLPGLTLGHAFGRLGCLMAGCCYGKPTGTNYGVIFNSDLVELRYRGIRLHPTQLYESISLFILFFGLLWVFKRKKFDGQVALTYLMAYPLIRSIVEAFRGDSIRGFVIEDVLSTSQFISILVFLVALIVLIWKIKRNPKT